MPDTQPHAASQTPSASQPHAAPQPRPERRPLPPLPPPLPPPLIDPDHLELESLKVVARLRRHGYEAFLVGGCVRDLLVGATPKDYDVVTDAHPDDVRNVFRNSRLVGRRFRLAHVWFPNGKVVEVATFRANPNASLEVAEPAEDLLVTDDNQYGTAEEDAKRRDFTINGLFYDVQDGTVIDHVGGLDDLRAKLVRTIGDPEIRLREDPVRGLRAARIAAKLGFDVERTTFDAMARHAGELPRCAPARVLEETLKLLRAGASQRAFQVLRDAGILRVLLPPVEEALVRGGAAAQAEFSARLGILDGRIAEGAAVTDAVMLATLLSFLPDPTADEDDDDSELDEEAIDDSHATILPSADHVLSQMSQHARLPRRVADRVRAIVASQKLFTAPPRRRRRRGKGGGFVRTPHFPEALELFEITVRATGRHGDALARWRVKYAESQAAIATAEHAATPPEPARSAAPPPAPAASDEAPTTPPDAPPPEANAAPADPNAPAKKRRKRGGRRHRRNKGPTDGTTQALATGDATASDTDGDDAEDTEPPDAPDAADVA